MGGSIWKLVDFIFAEGRPESFVRCPFCHSRDSRVIDSWKLTGGESICRRRECPVCSRRFTTYERVELAALMVVKKDGRRQEFDPESPRLGCAGRSPNALLASRKFRSWCRRSKPI